MFDSVPPNLPTTDTPPAKPVAPVPGGASAFPAVPPLAGGIKPMSVSPIITPTANPLPPVGGSSPASLQEEHVTVMPSKFFVAPKARVPWKKIGLALLVTVVFASGIVGVTFIVKSRIKTQQNPSTPAVALAPPVTTVTPPVDVIVPPIVPTKPDDTITPNSPPVTPPVTPPVIPPTTPPTGTPPTDPNTTAPDRNDRMLTSAPDADADGLGDEEEVIQGTDAAVADTDADGFNDGKEVSNLFSPNSPDPAKKLWETNVVNKYHHPTLGYEVLYPSAWVARSTSSDGQEIVFAAATGANIIVTALPNPERLTSAQWYAKLYPTGGVGSPVVTKSGLEGVSSPTGLVGVFEITSSGKSWALRFQYLATNSPVATYKTLYQMMVTSFQVPTIKAFWPF